MNSFLIPFTINIISRAIPVSVGAFYYKKLHSNYHYLLFLLLISFITEIILATLGLLRINNLFINNIYSVIESLLITMFFAHTIDSKKVRKIMIVTGLFVTAITIGDILLVSGVNKFGSLSFAIKSIMIIVFCLLVFFEMAMVRNESPRVGRIFWINGAMMFYYFSNLLYLGLNFWFLPPTAEAFKIQGWIHLVIYLTTNILIALGIWNTQRFFTWVLRSSR